MNALTTMADFLECSTAKRTILIIALLILL